MKYGPAFYRRRTFAEWAAALAGNRIYQRLEMLHQTALDVLAGRQVALCLAGVPGIGKSHLINRALVDARVITDPKNIKDGQVVFTRPKRWEDLVWAFDRAAKLGVPLVIEEGDRVLKNPNTLDILKIAGDRSGPRATMMKVRVDYQELTGYRADGEPRYRNAHRFVDQLADLSAPFFVTTNLDVHKMLDEALIDRWNVPTLPKDRETIWEYVVALAMTKDLIKFIEVDKMKDGKPVRDRNGRVIQVKRKVHHAQQNRALAIFTENMWSIKAFSLRTLKAIVADVVACADPHTHEIDEGKLAIRLCKHIADEVDPKFADRPVPEAPEIFTWQVVHGAQTLRPSLPDHA